MVISSSCARQYVPTYTEYVYCLRHPETFDIFYVGKTKSPTSRLKGHISQAVSEDPHKSKPKQAIIRSIVEKASKPIISLIDATEVRTEMDKLEAVHKELYWIKYYNTIGWNLTNQVNANASIDWTEFIRYSKHRRLSEEQVMRYYYFGNNKEGERIYDLTALSKHGYSLPCPEPEPKTEPPPRYNPWDNPRFVKMLGMEDEKKDEYWYRDTDPRYYDDDY